MYMGGEAESFSVPRNKTYVNLVIFSPCIWNYNPIYRFIRTKQTEITAFTHRTLFTLISISSVVATKKKIK